ncbi:MAG: hypothetical protein QOI47_1878 [Actinomycetota bacterium]|jgi:hypothetical protein|nr:hypothetical protein [Actinomycetota bacterium]
MAEGLDVLEVARRDIGVSVAELWCEYFALGGMCTALEVDAVLNGALVGASIERDRLAVALNERYAALGGDHPVPYVGDEPMAW